MLLGAAVPGRRSAAPELRPAADYCGVARPSSPPCRPAGTLAHYRNWAAQLQARYQLFNPDAARPAKRV